jgi:hypothetical protein
MNLLKSIVVAASPSKSYMPVGKAISVKDIKKQQMPSSTTLLQQQGKKTRKARIIKQLV